MPPRILSAIALLTIAIAGCSRTSNPDPPSDDDIGLAVYVGDQSIINYDPEPNLVTPVTPVDQARFTAIDIHCHWRYPQDPDAMLQAMDERNVRAAVNLSGGWDEELFAHLERFNDPRFITFCNINWDRIDDPDFATYINTFLTEAHRRGCGGVKIYKGLGLRVVDSNNELVPVDDPRLDPVWATAGRLGMPVLIHSADPVAFFQPTDERNERWMQLTRRPTWSFHGEDFPDREEVLAQRSRMMKKHPDTIFIGAHLGGFSEDLTAAAATLDEHPNLLFDISGRVAELGRQPYAARRFLIKYSDRILFGTDRYPGRPDQPRYRIYYRFLETADEYFDYHDHDFPPTGEWKIYGVYLPDPVLRRIYHDNAARILGLE